jgi:hypothetical protein
VNRLLSSQQVLQVQTRAREIAGIAVSVTETDLDAGSIRAEGESPRFVN